ncbi:hypothetical protein YA52_08745 [Enterobacter roggenkampii]|uniref:HNH endonuclease n=1 Tax=Enterobacter roggenkampii TaxID=1812935 RepID=UPI00063C24E2|nr:hypothetical protein [Enterobacter roggenkampii]KLG20809.1 hypothetical protein YA52_08745 [Enterobacter roggenkampii]
MFYLNKPAFTILDTYPVCISLVSNIDIQKHLEQLKKWVYLYAEVYDNLATQKKLNRLIKPVFFTPAFNENNEWLVKLYNYYLAKSTTDRNKDAYAFYQKIFSYETGSAVRRCCYCNSNKIDALDHFLPESKYNGLSVNPMNLVPSCDHCNESKGGYEPDFMNENTVLIHPYFDNILDIPWLKVCLTYEIVNGFKRIKSLYYVNQQIREYDEVVFDRIEKTIEKIKLNQNICHDADDFINTELIPEMRDGEYKNKSNDDLRMLFSQKSKRLNKQGYGLNHWKIAVYDFLSGYPRDFSDFL